MAKPELHWAVICGQEPSQQTIGRLWLQRASDSFSLGLNLRIFQPYSAFRKANKTEILNEIADALLRSGLTLMRQR